MDSLEEHCLKLLEKSQELPKTHSTMVVAYWLIGKAIVDEINSKDVDGKTVLKRVSDTLMPQYSINFSIRTLQFARKLYKLYPNRVFIENPFTDNWTHKFKENLSWSHYRTLTRIDVPEIRDELEKQSSTLHWNKKQLKRQTHKRSASLEKSVGYYFLKKIHKLVI